MIGRRARRTVLLVAVLLVVAGGTAGAADYEIRAFLSPDAGLTLDRAIRLVVSVEGQNSPQVSPPRLAGLENLRVLSGPSTNSQFSWANGKASAQLQFIYTLAADQAGQARIPALELQIDGATYHTNPIEFKVGAAAGGAPGRPPAAAAPGTGRESGGDPGRDVFLQAKLGAKEVWVGQPVPLDVTLYTAERISNLSWVEQPSFSNFWVEEIEVDPDAEAYRTQVGGRPYAAYPLARKLLVAPGPGRFKIEPYGLQVAVRSGRNDIFDMFNMGRGETIIRRSAPLELEVRQLPAGKPDGFGGAVGDYKLTAVLDRDEASVNDAVALRATVSGEGLLRAVEPPLFEALPDLKVFDPKVTESTSTVRGKVVSRKTWEWILVPLAPGEMELPALHLPYFDPGKAEYRIAESAPLGLVVRRGEGAPDAPLAHGEIQLRRRDLAFIKPLRGSLSEQHPRAHQRGLFRVLLLLPLALVPLAVILGRRHERLRKDHGLARARRAGSRARKRLRGARRRMDQMDSAAFHEELARTLVEYVADRFNRPPAGLTYELADELLASRGVKPELRRRFRACLESCDFARFVPAAGKSERRAESLDEAAGLIDELEREA